MNFISKLYSHIFISDDDISLKSYGTFSKTLPLVCIGKLRCMCRPAKKRHLRMIYEYGQTAHMRGMRKMLII